MPASVTPWSGPKPPQEYEVLAAMRAEGLSPYRWDNDPGYVYAAHDHPYSKVLCCVRGGIRFVLTDEGRSVDLRPGERLDLPPRTVHSAVVGPDGVACLEAWR